MREDFLEMRITVPKQVASSAEAKAILAATAVAGVSLAISFALPVALQAVAKSIMSRMWAVFNTLQILLLMPLMAFSLPSNVAKVY